MRRDKPVIRVKNASQLTVGIVVSEYNADITDDLFQGTVDTLRAWGVKEKNVTIVRVSGAFEVPYGCLTLLSPKKKGAKKPDAVIALGCIIKGETEHDRHLAGAVAHGIMDLSLRFNVPISFGVITTNNLAQAKVRSSGKSNSGVGAAVAALESALLGS